MNVRLERLIQSAARRVFEATGGAVGYEEHILLPHYGGNIMLRFRLGREETAKGELDSLERRLYELIPEGFLADFMGETYRKAGYAYGDLDAKLRNCGLKYRDETIPVSPFYDEVTEECRKLLRACGLSEDAEVWEIQSGEEPALLLLGDRNGLLGRADCGETTVKIYTAERTACEGLMKAAIHAQRNGISLMRAIETAWNSPTGHAGTAIEKVDRGTELADALLDFVQNCSWREAKDHIAKLIRDWGFTDWETMFAAVADGRIVGMASAMKTDYYPLPEIFPWVSCIFVSEKYRGKGLSGDLIEHANRYLARLGFERSYIPSEFFGLYERYGYRYVKDIVNYGGGIDHLFVREFRDD